MQSLLDQRRVAPSPLQTTISWRAASRSRTHGWPLTLVITRRRTGWLPTLCTAGSTSAPAVSMSFVQGTGPVRGTGTGGCAATVGRGVSSGRMRSDAARARRRGVGAGRRSDRTGGRRDGGRGTGARLPGAQPTTRRGRTGRGRAGQTGVERRRDAAALAWAVGSVLPVPAATAGPSVAAVGGLATVERTAAGAGTAAGPSVGVPPADGDGEQPGHRHHRRQRHPPPSPVHGGGQWSHRLPHSLNVSKRLLHVDGWAERARRPGGQAHSPGAAARPRVRLVPGQRARPALAPPRHDPVGGARQRVHAPADAGRAGGADLAGVDGALAATVGPRRRPARRRAARLGSARLPAARPAAARGGAGRRRAARRRRPGEPGGVGGAARRRLLHGAGRRGVRSWPALPGRRHERPPGGRAGRARCGRRRARAGSRRPRRRRRPAPARRRRGRARVRRR